MLVDYPLNEVTDIIRVFLDGEKGSVFEKFNILLKIGKTF